MKRITDNKFLRAVLLPPMALILILIPLSTAAVASSLKWLTSAHVLSIISYVLATYTLTVICMRIPSLVGWVRRMREDNKYIKAYFDDPRIRVKISLYGSFIFNAAYSLFQFFLGLRHASVWYYSLAAYYLLLAVMRILLLGHTRAYAPGEKYGRELSRYRTTGILLLVLNLALTSIIAFTVWQNKSIRHHEITVIAMAAYTFTAFTVSVINMVRFKKYKSPVFSAAKAIGLVAATVSMLSLESSMLVTFGTESDPAANRLMLALSGVAVTATVITLSVYMIVSGTKQIRQFRSRTTGEKNG